MMVERYPNLKEEVGSSIPGREISSLLDLNLALALACRSSVAPQKNVNIYSLDSCETMGNSPPPSLKVLNFNRSFSHKLTQPVHL